MSDEPEISPQEELRSISRVRTMAEWMRKTAQPAEKYPKLSKLTTLEAYHARQFAAGRYPWPKRWTITLYRKAVG